MNRRSIRRVLTKAHIISLLGLLLLAAISISHLSPWEGADAAQCESVYMYPAFSKINGMDSSHSRLATKYHLWLYREDGLDPFPEHPDFLQGIPVLFIPGNAGSYKQMRSIAAAAANQYFGDHQGRHNLDFFAADFNEDFTAFHGRTMLDQAEYLNDAVRFILELYSDRPVPPSSVLLLGHSMGGLVGRLMTTLDNHVPQSVNTIVTLSTPHAVAPVTFDGDILKIYHSVNEYWRHEFANATSFFSENMTLVSITGGIQDHILPADYTSVDGIVPESNGFRVFSTGIPEVWTPIDHLAIVWCNQMRQVVARILLNVVDPQTSSQTVPVAQRMRVFRKHLMSGLEKEAAQDSELVQGHVSEAPVPTHQIEWQDNQLPAIGEGVYTFSLKDSLSVVTSSHPRIWLCNDHCVEVTGDLHSVPGSKRVLQYNSTLLSGFDRAIVKGDFDVTLVSTIQKRTIRASLLSLLVGTTFHCDSNTLFQFPRIWNSLLSYKFHVNSRESHWKPFVRQSIGDETKWHVVSSPVITFYGSAPFVSSPADPLTLEVYTQGKTDMALRIHWATTLKNLLIRFRLAAAALPVALIAVVMAVQFSQYCKTDEFPAFGSAFVDLLNYWPVLYLVSSLLTPVLNTWPVAELIDLLSPVGYPNEAASLFLGITDTGLWWLGPLFLTLTITVVYVLNILVCLIGSFVPLSDCDGSGFKKRHFVGTLMLTLAVLLYIPYQFAFVLVCVVQLVVCLRPHVSQASKNFNQSVLILMLFIMAVNVPIVVVFLHNFAMKWETPFTSHHNALAVLPSILLVQTCASNKIPQPSRLTVAVMGYMGWYSLIYGVRGLYWLHYLFNFLAAWLLYLMV